MGAERGLQVVGEHASLEPYGESLTRREALVDAGDRSNTSTGPNTSSQHTFASAGTSSSTVGSKVVPSRLPPVSTVAPAVDRLVDPRLDPLGGRLVDHRADVRRRVVRVAGA